MKELYQRKIKSPIGPLFLVANQTHLHGLYFDAQKIPSEKNGRTLGILDLTEKQLQEYFEGRRKNFDIPLSFAGTDFQKLVWKQLKKIKFGKAISYKDLAKAVNNPRACRAVGTANGKNPIAIIIPCHRVINENRKIGGYGGGLDVKEYLLTLEGIDFNR